MGSGGLGRLDISDLWVVGLVELSERGLGWVGLVLLGVRDLLLVLLVRVEGWGGSQVVRVDRGEVCVCLWGVGRSVF